ncbi:MAG: hypothetical protein K0R12_1111 [Gammaproteobacteria bacterium]|jgi:type II secretory pathway pseudopilin PulG|nr:hypothetical protein [Gammaproteobacteria bacterium]
MKKKFYSAFSLLEITFVILLMSITIVSTSLYIRNANQKAAAKKAAQQISYWLNAAMGYYSARRAWPDSLTTLAESISVEAPSDSTYTFLPGSYERGAGIKVILPNAGFARLVQAELPRALLEKNTLYAYTPPVSTFLPTEAQVKGVGYLRFYNCRGSDTDHGGLCQDNMQSVCLDPGNKYSYNPGENRADILPFLSFQAEGNDNQQVNNTTSGECAIPVPDCGLGSVPQIFYAISQFRAPFAPINSHCDVSSPPAWCRSDGSPLNNGKPDSGYQSYIEQVDIICQASTEDKNIGPCGPNTALHDQPNDQLKYWSIAANIRSSNQYNGTTIGKAYFADSGGTDRNYSGTYFAESSPEWSAVASYIIACIPKTQIINGVSGGMVYYLSGGSSDTLAQSTAYSQDMMNPS